jgi:hypothetical protein
MISLNSSIRKKSEKANQKDGERDSQCQSIHQVASYHDIAQLSSTQGLCTSRENNAFKSMMASKDSIDHVPKTLAMSNQGNIGGIHNNQKDNTRNSISQHKVQIFAFLRPRAAPKRVNQTNRNKMIEGKNNSITFFWGFFIFCPEGGGESKSIFTSPSSSSELTIGGAD